MSKSYRRPSLALALGIVSLASHAGVAGSGCAEVRQNIRGQELSYRGTYFCERDGCNSKSMVRSTKSSLEGATTIATVKLRPRAALLFTAVAPFDTLSATVTDCKGHRATVAAGDIVKPGKHDIGDAHARESWAVFVDEQGLGDLELTKKGECSTWRIQATARWSDGATYSLASGIHVER